MPGIKTKNATSEQINTPPPKRVTLEESRERYEERYNDAIGYIQDKMFTKDGSIIRQIFRMLPLIFIEGKVIAAFTKKDSHNPDKNLDAANIPSIDTLTTKEIITDNEQGRIILSFKEFLDEFPRPNRLRVRNEISYASKRIPLKKYNEKKFDARDYFGLPCKYGKSAPSYTCNYFRYNGQKGWIEIWVATRKEDKLFPRYHADQILRLVLAISLYIIEHYKISGENDKDVINRIYKAEFTHEKLTQQQTKQGISPPQLKVDDEYVRRILETLHKALLADMGWQDQPNNIFILLSPDIYDYSMQFFLTHDQRHSFSQLLNGGKTEALKEFTTVFKNLNFEGKRISEMSEAEIAKLLNEIKAEAFRELKAFLKTFLKELEYENLPPYKGKSISQLSDSEIVEFCMDAFENKLPKKYPELLQKGTVNSLVKLRNFYDIFIYDNTIFNEYPVLCKSAFFEDRIGADYYKYDRDTLGILEKYFLVELAGQTKNMSLAVFPLLIKDNAVGSISFFIPEDNRNQLYSRLSSVLRRIDLAKIHLQEAEVKQACSIILRTLEESYDTSNSEEPLDKRLNAVSRTINEGPLCGTVFLGNAASLLEQIGNYLPTIKDEFEKTIGSEEPYNIEEYIVRKYQLREVENNKEKLEYYLVCIDHKESFSAWDLTDDIDIRETVETAIMAFKRKYAILMHGTKAAMAAIMTRNMSHNIGSHVISYWNQVFDKLGDAYNHIIPKNDIENEEAINVFQQLKTTLEGQVDIAQINRNRLLDMLFWSSSANAIDKDSNAFFHYLQQRMDFIAEIVTSSPAWERTMDLKRDILDPFINLNPLGMYIAYSENLSAEYKLDDSQLKKYFGTAHSIKNKLTEYINSLEGVDAAKKTAMKCCYNRATEKNIRNTPRQFLKKLFCAGVTLKEHKQNLLKILYSPELFALTITHKLPPGNKVLCASIPHGLVGVHAFYSILENFIRNSAKHGTKGGKKRDLEITIEINDPGKDENFYEILLSDNMGNCNQGFLEDKILPYLNGEKSALIDLKSGEISHEGWGIKEMKISANFLNMNSAEDLLNNHEEILSTSCLDKQCLNCSSGNNICYVFKLLKPFDLLIVNDDKIINKKFEDDKTFTIHASTASDFVKYIKVNAERHKIIVFVHPDKKLLDEISEKKEVITPRVLIVGKGKQTEYADLKIDCEMGIGIRDCYWAYINHLGYKVNSKILIRDTDESFKQCENNICCYSKDMPTQEYYAVFDRHGDNIRTFYDEKKKCFKENAVYYQQYIGSSSFTSFIKDLAQTNDTAMKEFASLELLEAVLTKIIIVDERIVSLIEQTKSIKGIDIPMVQLFRKMGIYVVRDVKKGMTLKELIAKMEHQMIPINGATHFFIIHQGIMDKSTDSIKKWEEWLLSLPVPHKVVDSGRGRPRELFKKVRFIQISALLKMLGDFDKYSLVQTLYSLRRPKDTRLEEK